MSNFATMPLRFRVWDNHRSIFVPWDENYCFARDEDGKLYLSNIDWSSKDLPEEDESRFIISQDTGLEDKNGKSIYTGDILRVTAKADTPKFGTPVVVKYYQQEIHIVNAEETHSEWLGKYCEYGLEVISNIWQNPELLEGGE